MGSMPVGREKLLDFPSGSAGRFLRVLRIGYVVGKCWSWTLMNSRHVEYLELQEEGNKND